MSARLLIGVLVLAACGEPSVPAITVGPASFTERELLGLTEARRRALAELTAFGLAVADSTTADLGAPLLVEQVDDRLLEILAAELTLEDNGVGDDVLQARYLTDPAWELTVRHILVFSERWRSAAHREAAAAKAARARALLEGGTDFPAVEAALADVPGGEAREGRLPAGREGAWVPEFWAAALELEPGEISPVTETRYGYHVLRLDDRQLVPFAEARSALARQVAGTLEDPARVLEAWMAAAGGGAAGGRAAALAEVRARGLEVPAGERAELFREWEDRVTSWSTALGFRHGLSPEQVAQAALTALASPGQTAEIARTELARHSELLHARYEIRLGTGTPASPQP